MTFMQDYLHSVGCLIYEVAVIAADRNLLPEGAASQNKFMFSDAGVPLPRPCTALAWASLCSLNPIQGLRNEKTGEYVPYDVSKGRFLIPFLPKLFAGDEQNQSLQRASKRHVTDERGGIQWGDVYIGDARTGELLIRLSHGQVPAIEFAHVPRHHTIRPGSITLPPLYQTFNSGWQFGVIQGTGQSSTTLREPMIELARNGILLGDSLAETIPIRVKRLLLRFTRQDAAARWAAHYAVAQKGARDSDTIEEDMEELRRETARTIEKRKRTATKVKDRVDRIPDDVFKGLEDML